MFAQDDIRVLIVDDNPDVHRDFRNNFALPDDNVKVSSHNPPAESTDITQPSSSEYRIDSACEGEEAFEKIEMAMAEDRPYAVVFIDFFISRGLTGVETIQKIWSHWPSLHVVLSCDRAGVTWKDQLHQLGSTDRLFILKKPFDPIEVRQLVVTLARKQSRENAADSMIEQLRQTIARKTEELKKEIDHRKRIEAAWRANRSAIQTENETDEVTGVFNSKAIVNYLARAIEASAGTSQPFSVLTVNIDHFKNINGTFGHETGDEILKRVAQLLGSTLRPADKLGRYGGKEFVVILPNCELNNGYLVGERLRAIVARESIQIEHEIIPVTISVGVVSASNSQSVTLEQILEKANVALGQAKNSGRNRVEIFAPPSGSLLDLSDSINVSISEVEH